MKEHLQTTSTVLFIAALATGIYFEPLATMVIFIFLFLYAAIYAEITEAKQKKNEKKTTRENN
jgi:hypothetical protein